MPNERSILFLVASTREPGQQGNTEWLARRAAEALPAGCATQWLHLAQLTMPVLVDRRHTTGEYPVPEGDLGALLDATMAASDIVFVAPVYWYSLPSTLKIYLDHWTAWMRTPGVPFKVEMAKKALWLITTSGDREKAQPMIDSVRMCCEFLGMRWGGELWGKGGPPGAVQGDQVALERCPTFLGH